MCQVGDRVTLETRDENTAHPWMSKPCPKNIGFNGEAWINTPL